MYTVSTNILLYRSIALHTWNECNNLSHFVSIKIKFVFKSNCNHSTLQILVLNVQVNYKSFKLQITRVSRVKFYSENALYNSNIFSLIFVIIIYHLTFIVFLCVIFFVFNYLILIFKFKLYHFLGL